MFKHSLLLFACLAVAAASHIYDYDVPLTYYQTYSVPYVYTYQYHHTPVVYTYPTWYSYLYR